MRDYSEEFIGYKRSLWRYFEREGLERTKPSEHNGVVSGGQLINAWELQEPYQTQVWLRDSLLWTFEMAESDQPIYALRGLLQAAAYAGRVGHDSVTGDALNALKNWMENQLNEAHYFMQVASGQVGEDLAVAWDEFLGGRERR